MAFLTHWWRFFLGKVVFFRFSRRCAHHFACTTTAFASPTRQQQQQQTEKQKQTKNDRDRLANRRRWPDVGHRKRFIFIFFSLARGDVIGSRPRPRAHYANAHLAHPFVPLPWHRGGQPIPVKPGEKKTTQKRRDTETSDWDRFSFVIVSSSFHDCLPSCSRKGVGLELELVGLPNSLSATSNRRGAFV